MAVTNASNSPWSGRAELKSISDART
jgi:hypothetical protein